MIFSRVKSGVARRQWPLPPRIAMITMFEIFSVRYPYAEDFEKIKRASPKNLKLLFLILVSRMNADL